MVSLPPRRPPSGPADGRRTPTDRSRAAPDEASSPRVPRFEPLEPPPPPEPPPEGEVHARPLGSPPTLAPLSPPDTGRDPAVADDPPAPVPGTGAHDTLRAGDLLAQRYQLVSLLGRGAMGEVWKAKHLLLQGNRAIKVITPGLSRDPEFRRRFIREGQTMMKIRHAGVVEVTDLDQRKRNGQLFMAMEHIEGRTLYEAIRDAASPLAGDPREAVRVLREVCLGMQRIHDERVVHKDLKSDNALLVAGDDGLRHPKVIDFGLAKQVSDADSAGDGAGGGGDLATTLSGTLAYMAPELFSAKPSSFRTDIYAFGVLAFETFTRGEYPLPRGDAVEYIRAHAAGESIRRLREARPDLDRDLAAILDACLAREPGDRPESFRAVADELQRWLDAPERRRRRNRAVVSAAGAAACVGAAVWGIFFAGRTASLGAVEVASGSESIAPRADRRIHLAGRALGAVSLSAAMEGESGDPSLEVDGRPHPAQFRIAEDRLSADADLSDLADGEHVLALRAAAGAAPATARIVVDREAPALSSVRVDGSPDDRTNSEAPVVMVEVAGDAASIDHVSALVAGREVPARRPEGGAGPWIVSGTAERDGRVELVILAHDLAGNATTRTWSYVRDVDPPGFAVADRVDAPGAAPEARVREPIGATLRVRVDEPSTVSLAIGGGTAAALRADPSAPAEFPLPAVPQAGIEAVLTVADLARNEVREAIRIRAVEDVESVTSAAGGDEDAVRRDRAARLLVTRSYPREGAIVLTATRLLDGRGTAVEEAPVDVACDVVSAADGGLRAEVSVPAGSLAAGLWSVASRGGDGARQVPLRLFVDSDPPAVAAVRILDAAGREPGPGGWITTRDAVVEVDAEDLSLRKIELSGRAPAEPPRPGRATYTFRVPCEREGLNTWTLTLSDAARNDGGDSITVRADWTVPQLSLTGPRSGDEADDVRLTEFAGRCSEAPFVLRIAGPDGALEPGRRLDAAEFVHGIQLPAHEALDLRVVAVDDAGHESAPQRVVLRVRHVETGLPDEIAWSRGVEVRMRRIDAGDVVFGGRAHSVRRSFMDLTEVTNAQYRAFLADLRAGGGHGACCHADEPKGWSHEPPPATWGDAAWSADALPVVNVAWWDAHAFAKWSGRRLPTEAEWVRAAAKAADEDDLRAWPPFRGDAWQDGVLATAETGAPGPAPAAGGSDLSPSGCLHMGGNVSEWVDMAGGAAGVRGGNWFLTKAAADVRAVPGRACERSLRARTIGFRCSADPEGGRR